MGIVRAIVKFPNVSGLTADETSNTFHFTSPADFGAGDGDIILAALNSFYSDNHIGGASPSLSALMSSKVSRAAHAQVTMYSLDMGDPGEADDVLGAPVYSWNFALDDPASPVDLPEQLAVCLSYTSNLAGVPERVPLPPVGPKGDQKLRARRRGRIFLGPLNEAATAGNRPHAQMINQAKGAAQFLASDPVALGDWAWSVYSRADARTHVITGGWVDNRFDVQRRRAALSTARGIW